jgi:hypothetical protein
MDGSASTTVGVGILCGLYLLFIAKAEIDYWNTHSESYRRMVWGEIFCGVPLAIFAVWACRTASSMSPIPALVFIDYVCGCMVINAYRNMREQSVVSKNFGEWCLFGFCKTDDYIGSFIKGCIGLLFCSCCLFNMIAGANNYQSVYAATASSGLKANSAHSFTSHHTARSHHAAGSHHK